MNLLENGFLKAGEIISNNKIKKEHIYEHREIKSKEIIALHF